MTAIDPARFTRALGAAIARRGNLAHDPNVQAVRLLAGAADNTPGIYLDRYGPGAVLAMRTEQEADESSSHLAAAALGMTSGLGVTSVYAKLFARDRSALGGAHPAMHSDPTPAAGAALPESIVVREHGWTLEARLYDGFSTGIFADHRDNRRHLAGLMRERAAAGRTARVLNTFCYTGAFSVACAVAHPEVEVASVDVSPRYLEWARRNFGHNGLDAASQRYRFAKMDTFEFFAYARRKSLLFDLVILDPPSFSAGNKRRGVPTWSSTEDYPRLVAGAVELLDPKGARLLFASTNTAELCLPGRFERVVAKGLEAPARFLELPPPAPDYAVETGRLAARLADLGQQ